MWVLYLALAALGVGTVYAIGRGYQYWLSMVRAFPRLRSRGYRLTSLPTGQYNCIAWAAGDTSHWWDSSLDGYWPQGATKGRTINHLIAAYQTCGFTLCMNGNYQNGVEKIALYARNGQWTHAAKQLDANWWSSKLGKNYDISHRRPDDLNGNIYGQVTRYMSR